MGPDHPGGVVQEWGEALAEGEEAVVGWEEHAPELVPEEIAFALTVGQKFPIKLELPAIT